MSKELIERLRADAESTDDIGLCADAAERIEQLEIERDQLREQVKVLWNVIEFYMDNGICEPLYHKAKEALAAT